MSFGGAIFAYGSVSQKPGLDQTGLLWYWRMWPHFVRRISCSPQIREVMFPREGADVESNHIVSYKVWEQWYKPRPGLVWVVWLQIEDWLVVARCLPPIRRRVLSNVPLLCRFLRISIYGWSQVSMFPACHIFLELYPSALFTPTGAGDGQLAENSCTPWFP